MEFRFEHIGGHRIRYVESGAGTKNALLVHGLGGSAESWMHNVDALSKHFRVLAPDLIGFGHSDKPKMEYNIPMFVDFLNRFMNHMNMKSANVIGSSMGGQIAAELAISNPEMVEKLILVSPAGIPPKSFKGTKELWRYGKMFDAGSLNAIRKALEPLGDAAAITDDYVKNVFAYVSMDGSKHAFMSSLRGSSTAPRLATRLSAIRSDTLVIWGRDDRMIPVKYCEPFVTKMRNCRVVILEKCGHRPHFEKPALFNKLVTEFIES